MTHLNVAVVTFLFGSLSGTFDFLGVLVVFLVLCIPRFGSLHVYTSVNVPNGFLQRLSFLHSKADSHLLVNAPVVIKLQYKYCLVFLIQCQIILLPTLT